MAGKKQLRPVAPGEVAAPRSVSEAGERGTRLDELRAVRRIIAAHLDSENTLARDVASLSLRLMDLSREIETLELREAEESLEVAHGDGASDAKWRPEAI